MVNKHPRLRHHSRRRKSGRVVTYYFYDMRGTGEPDVPLGTDYDEAIKRWDEIHNRKPRIAGTLEEAFSQWEAEVLPAYKSAETKKGYAKSLRRIRPAFGKSTWDAVTFAHLKAYLKARSAKVQGNREMALLSVIWNWARGEGMTALPWPAAGLERSKWKNREEARTFEVTDALFSAVYEKADQTLRDCMDISTATGLRITDARLITVPQDGRLRFQASKTSKPAYFDVAASAVLSAIWQRRKSVKAMHIMFLSTPTGRPVSYSMLRSRWDSARKAAAEQVEKAGDEDLAHAIRAMYLRDMRKRASDLAGTVSEAAELLQHSSQEVTKRHYRTRAVRLKAVR